jgi:hypothetical protein
VIDEGLFQAAQAARQNNLASGRGPKGKLITDLFRGILTCAYCGSPVKFKSKSNIKSLMCSRVIEKQGCVRKAWSYRNFESSFLEFVTNHELDLTADPGEREPIVGLIAHIRSLSEPDVYDARMGIVIALKATVAELRIASAGQTPATGSPGIRIRLDDPGRYFEIRFRGGSAYTGFPLEK